MLNSFRISTKPEHVIFVRCSLEMLQVSENYESSPWVLVVICFGIIKFAVYWKFHNV